MGVPHSEIQVELEWWKDSTVPNSQLCLESKTEPSLAKEHICINENFLFAPKFNIWVLTNPNNMHKKFDCQGKKWRILQHCSFYQCHRWNHPCSQCAHSMHVFGGTAFFICICLSVRFSWYAPRTCERKYDLTQVASLLVYTNRIFIYNSVRRSK